MENLITAMNVFNSSNIITAIAHVLPQNSLHLFFKGFGDVGQVI